MEFNFNNFIENQNKINNGLITSNQNIGEAIKEVKQQGIDIISKEVGELKNNLLKIQNNINILTKDNEEKGQIIENINNDMKNLKEQTLVLATDDGKQKELTKLIQSLTYKYNGTKNTIEDCLFHRKITNDCYTHLYNIYQVNTYKRIKIEDYEEAIKSIKRWFGNKQNIKKSRNKKLQDLRKKIDKNIIKNNEEKLYDKYMDKQSRKEIA